MRRLLVALLALVLAATASACDAEDPKVRASELVSPFQPCPTGGSPAMSPAAGLQTLSVVLPCFTGGEPVALSGLGRPAVINLWASWCAPCRAELPEFQRLAGLAGGNVVVLGVVTEDTRGAAASLAQDLMITFPAVFDDTAQVQHVVAPSVLPVTVFVDSSGGVRHVDKSGALSLAALRELVSKHLGVVIS